MIHVIVSVDDETDFMHTIRFTHDDTVPSTDNPRFCIGALRIDYIARTIEVVHREVGVDDVETRAVCSPAFMRLCVYGGGLFSVTSFRSVPPPGGGAARFPSLETVKTVTSPAMPTLLRQCE